jgi:hypothetical protein
MLIFVKLLIYTIMATKFVSTMTIGAIKAQEVDPKFRVMHREGADADCKFWVCGSLQGPVSKKGYATDPVVSTTEDGVMILHNRSAAAVVEEL